MVEQCHLSTLMALRDCSTEAKYSVQKNSRFFGRIWWFHHGLCQRNDTAEMSRNVKRYGQAKGQCKQWPATCHGLYHGMFTQLCERTAGQLLVSRSRKNYEWIKLTRPRRNEHLHVTGISSHLPCLVKQCRPYCFYNLTNVAINNAAAYLPFDGNQQRDQSCSFCV